MSFQVFLISLFQLIMDFSGLCFFTEIALSKLDIPSLILMLSFLSSVLFSVFYSLI